MKSIGLAAIAALSLAACAPAAPPAATGTATTAPVSVTVPSGVYHLDPNHGALLVRATHFGLSHYTLRLARWDATINFNAEHPDQSAVTATADAKSVQTDYRGATNFDGELENSDWLDADTHPQLTFQSTSVTLTGPNTGRVTGNLTVRGITKPVSFDITLVGNYPHHPLGAPGAYMGFSAHGTFKRSDYGMMKYQAPAALPAAGVSDEVEIVIEAEFNNNPPAPVAATTTTATTHPAG